MNLESTSTDLLVPVSDRLADLQSQPSQPQVPDGAAIATEVVATAKREAFSIITSARQDSQEVIRRARDEAAEILQFALAEAAGLDNPATNPVEEIAGLADPVASVPASSIDEETRAMEPVTSSDDPPPPVQFTDGLDTETSEPGDDEKVSPFFEPALASRYATHSAEIPRLGEEAGREAIAVATSLRSLFGGSLKK